MISDKDLDEMEKEAKATLILCENPLPGHNGFERTVVYRQNKFIIKLIQALRAQRERLKEAIEIIKDDYMYYVNRIPEHREYSRVDLHRDFLEKWGIE